MYRVKDDKRTIKSANAISLALLSCLKQKHFEDITITDISKQSNVGRSTFYRLFDNTVDILVYQADCLFESFSANISNPEDAEILEKAIDFCFENQTSIETLFLTGRMDIMISSFEKNLKNNLSKFVIYVDNDEMQFKYDFALLACTIVGALGVWVKEGQKESKEELCYRIKNYLKLINKNV